MFWAVRRLQPLDCGANAVLSPLESDGRTDTNEASTNLVAWQTIGAQTSTVQELPILAAQQFLTIIEPGGEPRLKATRENGQVQLTLTGKQGSRYAIETSTALPNWTSTNLTVTVTNQSGAITFPAPGATNDPQRFYRAVWQ